MDCPRCGFAVFAEHPECPDCGWELARPYGTTRPASRRPLRVVGPPPIQTAADAAPDEFFLSAPSRFQPVRKFPRRRAAHSHRRERPFDSNAVPALSDAADPNGPSRWEPLPGPDVVGMPLVQTAFDFSAAEQEVEAVHAAPVEARLRAGLLDVSLLLLAGGVFFGVFALLAPPSAGLGAPMAFARRDLLVYLLAGFALASLYFGLFAVLGGRTPGMLYCGLHVVAFDGRAPTLSRAMWRAFGYVVSTGSLLLGFAWALVDERRLTWHDHISRTFVTDYPPL